MLDHRVSSNGGPGVTGNQNVSRPRNAWLRRLAPARAITQKTGWTLARLFDAVLDLSKLESGHVNPNYARVDLSRVTEETVEQLTSFAARRACSN